jgi:hypothetical protein
MTDPIIYNEAPKYFHYYYGLIPSNDLITALEENLKSTLELLQSVPSEKENYAYNAGKWTTKEVFKHIIECERIFAYRALRFSRFDSTPLPGFNENDYIENSKGMNPRFDELISEFELVRQTTIALFKYMSPEMLQFQSSANNTNYSTRAIGFMIVGHCIHHCNVVKEQYLGI